MKKKLWTLIISFLACCTLTIGEFAFDYCNSLTNIVLPESLISIGTHAFYNCSSLKSITIGSGLKTIENYAFSQCPNLKHVYYRADNILTLNIGKGNDVIKSATYHYHPI